MDTYSVEIEAFPLKSGVKRRPCPAISLSVPLLPQKKNYCIEEYKLPPIKLTLGEWQHLLVWALHTVTTYSDDCQACSSLTLTSTFIFAKRIRMLRLAPFFFTLQIWLLNLIFLLVSVTICQQLQSESALSLQGSSLFHIIKGYRFSYEVIHPS